MRDRFIASLATPVALFAILFLMTPAAASQSARTNAEGKAAIPRTFDGKPDLSGVWAGPAFKHVDSGKYTSIPAPGLIRFDQKNLPFVPGGEALWNKKLTGDPLHDDPTLFCLPIGMPYIHLTARAQQFFQPTGYLVIVYENQHMTRIIPMDGRPHPKDLEPTWMGHSVGYYEGDSAIVDTVGLKAWGSDLHGNHMHTEAAHYIEKFTRTGPTTMTYELTTDDPKIFSRPWKAGPWEARLQPTWEILEDICEENNKDPQLLEYLNKSK